LRVRIDALPLPLSERKNDEPPKLNWGVVSHGRRVAWESWYRPER
jgi:hypothetical protein